MHSKRRSNAAIERFVARDLPTTTAESEVRLAVHRRDVRYVLCDAFVAVVLCDVAV